MNMTHSIESKIIQLFLMFTLFLSAVYSLLLLGYSWMVEDNVFNRLVNNETQYITQQHKQTSELVKPRLSYMAIYESWDELPDGIGLLHVENPNQIEFNLSSGGTLHLKEFNVGGKRLILAADVSSIEVGKEYLPAISSWLIIAVVMISLCAFGAAMYVAKNAINPLRKLTENVAVSKHKEIKPGFASGYPENEIGFLANTFEQSILHIQHALKRETDFTQDVSHELRTPTTILKNLVSKVSADTPLSEKHISQFHEAVVQLEQTVTTLLALARQESLNTQSLRLLDVLEDCIVNHYELNHYEQKHQQEFILDVDVSPEFKITANTQLLTILINNLLSNAVNYATANHLRIYVVNKDIIFENDLADDHIAGENLANKDADTAFNPLQQHVKGHKSQGLGLGLNLVSRVANTFDWQVTSTNVNDKFRIILTT